MDAYRILGVQSGASPEEIKKRYRQLVKQYHPDLHPDDEEAARKMSEINAAYEAIRSGAAVNSAPSGTYTKDGVTYQYQYEDISDILREMFGMKGVQGDMGNYAFLEMYIREGNYRTAARLLDTMPRNDARWYYYAAHVLRWSGDYEKAISYAKTSSVMDPLKFEYTLFAEQLEIEYDTAVTAKNRSRFWVRFIAVLLAVMFIVFILMHLF